jgi:hypothetical protein
MNDISTQAVAAPPSPLARLARGTHKAADTASDLEDTLHDIRRALQRAIDNGRTQAALDRVERQLTNACEDVERLVESLGSLAFRAARDRREFEPSDDDEAEDAIDALLG